MPRYFVVIHSVKLKILKANHNCEVYASGIMRCYSQRKVKNSESKSQLACAISSSVARCYSQRKVKNSESKSQPEAYAQDPDRSCYSQRKVKNSESKSQRTLDKTHPV